jgi:transposase
VIKTNESICPECGQRLIHYDSVRRIVRTKGRVTTWIKLRRLQCLVCGGLHRELPDFIFPFKQYEAEIIIGVLEDLITSDTLGYEDYPCEMTMIRWQEQKIRILARGSV